MQAFLRRSSDVVIVLSSAKSAHIVDKKSSGNRSVRNLKHVHLYYSKAKVYTPTYTDARAHTRTHIHKHTYTRAHTHTHTRRHINTRTRTHTEREREFVKSFSTS